MTRVILLTDFSESALHAAVYAVRMFGNVDVTYSLLHAYYEPGMADPAVQPNAAELLEAIDNELSADKAKVRERAGALFIDQHLLFGPLAAALHAYIGEQGGDIVVMGQHIRHAGGHFGKDTTKVVQGCPVPVLIVPERVGARPLQRILLADDHDVVSSGDLKMLRAIALQHDAEVIIAHAPVTVEEGADHWSNGIYTNGLSGVPVRFVEAHGRDVADALARSARRQRADLLAVIHRHKGVVGRLFHASTAKELILEGDKPLLVLEQCG